jgi:hypothetical protein
MINITHFKYFNLNYRFMSYNFHYLVNFQNLIKNYFIQIVEMNSLNKIFISLEFFNFNSFNNFSKSFNLINFL